MLDLAYKPRYFSPDELVPKSVFDAAQAFANLLFPKDETARDTLVEYVVFSLFEPKLLESLDWLRDRYGPCRVNNWAVGGENQFRGLRMEASQHYSPTSMHSLKPDRLVGAADCSFKVSAEYIRRDIKEREANGEKFPFTRIEDDVSWIHVDVKPTGLKEVYFFKP